MAGNKRKGEMQTFWRVSDGWKEEALIFFLASTLLNTYSSISVLCCSSVIYYPAAVSTFLCFTSLLNTFPAFTPCHPDSHFSLRHTQHNFQILTPQEPDRSNIMQGKVSANLSFRRLQICTEWKSFTPYKF